jgi:bacillithiol system protein YtxJ
MTDTQTHVSCFLAWEAQRTPRRARGGLALARIPRIDSEQMGERNAVDAHFTPVMTVGMLEQLLARSATAPVLVFLHDPGCGISARAYRELSQLAGPIPLIDVAVARSLSRLIEQRTGVKHESPQVLLLHHGRAVWSASHWAITVAAVQGAMAKHR